jgi:hypothetical protein
VKDLIGKRAESSKNPPVKTGGFVYKRQATAGYFFIYAPAQFGLNLLPTL